MVQSRVWGRCGRGWKKVRLDKRDRTCSRNISICFLAGLAWRCIGIARFSRLLLFELFSTICILSGSSCAISIFFLALAGFLGRGVWVTWFLSLCWHSW